MNTVALIYPPKEYQCPICGRPNECAAAAPGSFEDPCWCLAAQFASDVLAKIPDNKRGKACVCRFCVGKGKA